MNFAQQIDFMLTKDQILKLLDDSEVNVVRVSWGVEYGGDIKVRSWGAKYVSGNYEIKTDPEDLCPVPPDCHKDEKCLERVNKSLAI